HLGRQWDTIVRTRIRRGLGGPRSPRMLAGATLALLVDTLRGAEQQALAMDARGFAGADQRSWAEPSPLHRADLLGAGIGALLLAWPLLAQLLAGWGGRRTLGRGTRTPSPSPPTPRTRPGTPWPTPCSTPPARAMATPCSRSSTRALPWPCATAPATRPSCSPPTTGTPRWCASSPPAARTWTWPTTVVRARWPARRSRASPRWRRRCWRPGRILIWEPRAPSRRRGTSSARRSWRSSTPRAAEP